MPILKLIGVILSDEHHEFMLFYLFARCHLVNVMVTLA